MDPYLNTYSVVAYDHATKSWGVAVASKWLAVGSLCAYARADAGAIATQAFTNVSFGPRGLDLLETGASAQEVITALLKNDPERESRQLGVVDKNGHAATYTGEKCLQWAGGLAGNGIAAQGNTLTGEDVVRALHESRTESEDVFAKRLYAALVAGELAGGDSRGKQSAALLVVKAGGGLDGKSDRVVDLRVDDHQAPVQELGRLLQLHLELYKQKPD
ncbi:DUF1028 domain-containing protein [Patescibacteria group bacterium]|nr:DUF1028 domain-containing protein [Patescibacteria group bacterium]